MSTERLVSSNKIAEHLGNAQILSTVDCQKNKCLHIKLNDVENSKVMGLTNSRKLEKLILKQKAHRKQL